ncbi:MAG: class I SAM-dependent methyltransferase [Ktedonobacteraceae bacterium]|nr:class I SAM-dependent methyltransferase [Ktedonobacteraceae bacterium]
MHEYELIAPFYDIEHAHFSEDLDLYRNFAELSGGKILELACGSGRVLLPLAQEGYEVTGVDSSAAMLALARTQIEAAGLGARCTLEWQNIITLHLEQKFRMAFIALGSFAHITTRKEQMLALKAIHAHLSPGGTFIIDISNADARYLEDLGGHMLHQATRERDDGTFLTHFVSPATATDRHLLELTHFYEEHRQGGPVHRTTVTTHLYLFERNEMELLLERAGFAVKDVYGDYDLSPYQLESPRMICIAEAH